MKNIDIDVKDDFLTIRIDLTKDFGISKSGKSMIVATTEGNKKIPGYENLRIGVNCYEVK